MLGTGQSGHIAAVGYDLYCQMVTEAVAELAGEVQPEPVEISIDLPVGAGIPADYMPKEELRLEAYRRVAGCQAAEEVDDVAAEWADRYGPLPAVAQALLDGARLRCECLRTGVREVSVVKGPGFGGPKWEARVRPVQLRPSRRVRLERLYPQAGYVEASGLLKLPVESAAAAAETVIGSLRDLVSDDERAAALLRRQRARGKDLPGAVITKAHRVDGTFRSGVSSRCDDPGGARNRVEIFRIGRAADELYISGGIAGLGTKRVPADKT